MEDELIKALTIDLKLTLYCSLNSFNNQEIVKRCNCKKTIENILKKLNNKNVIYYVNIVLERCRKEREEYYKLYKDNLNYDDYELSYPCVYNHVWFEKNIRSYLFSNPCVKINTKI